MKTLSIKKPIIEHVARSTVLAVDSRIVVEELGHVAHALLIVAARLGRHLAEERVEEGLALADQTSGLHGTYTQIIVINMPISTSP